MNGCRQDNQIGLMQRQALIQPFPCFSSLSNTAMAELAALFSEVSFHSKDVIVTENELVDSIFIIVNGDAEVTRATEIKKRIVSIPVAALHAGEAIGLNDTGFYSETGKRKATVTALTKMLLLKIELKDLYEFLRKNNLEASMTAASLQMLYMRFIKQSLPFARISHERLQWLASCVEDHVVSAGTMIFKQGDAGDKCYMVRSGKVEIFSQDEHGHEKQLAILNPSVLFGEATLITRSPRNASARALVDTELLMLSHDNLSELLESDENVAKMFMTLMVDRSLPLQNKNVSVHTRVTSDGQTITILKNASNGSYFKLSAEGVFIWQQLDGKHTLQDITMDLADQHNVFAPDVVAGVIFKLTKFGYVSNVQIDDALLTASTSLWASIMLKLRRVFEARYALGDADKWITRAYQHSVRYLFTKPVQMMLAVIAIWGFVSFVAETSTVLQFFSATHKNLFLLLGLIPFSLLAVLLHELGHAFAVKAFGRDVHYIGIGWFWFGPIAFTDTSDIWLASRKERMLVNFAGIYVDILLAGLSSLFLILISNPYLQAMLWLFSLYTYIGGFRKLSPLQDSDGYYILMDWMEKTRLRLLSVVWLAKKLPQSIRHPALFKESRAEISYWLICIIYLFLTTILTLVVQDFVFVAVGIQLANRYIALIIPFLVLIISCLSIVAEVRTQQQ